MGRGLMGNTGPWTPPGDRFGTRDNVVSVKTNLDTLRLEWIEMSSEGVGIHIDVKDLRWAIDTLEEAWRQRRLEINSQYGKAFDPKLLVEVQDFMSEDLRDLSDKEFAASILTARRPVNQIRHEAGLPKYNEAEEKDMRCDTQIDPVVERVPVFHALRVTMGTLQELSEWLGAKKYTIKDVKNKDELRYGDTVKVVDFHVKDKNAAPEVDFHIRAEIGHDYIVRDPNTGGFFVMGNFEFNERFQAPRLGPSDIPCR